jgi:hypothetical protein
MFHALASDLSKFFTRTAFGAALTFAAFTATPAIIAAQAEAATAELTEISREPFELYKYITCDDLTCSAQFYTVGRHRYLDIQHMSCMVGVDSPGHLVNLMFRHTLADTESLVYDFLAPEFSGEFNGLVYYSANHTTRLIVPAKQHLSVNALASTDIDRLQCKITGDLVRY